MLAPTFFFPVPLFLCDPCFAFANKRKACGFFSCDFLLRSPEMFQLRLSVFLLLVLSATTSLCPSACVHGADSPTMEEKVKTVTFTDPPHDKVYTATVNVSSIPAHLKLLIESSAGSGGYAFMAHDVLKGINRQPSLELEPLAEDEMRERLQRSVSKHGVTVGKPAIEHMKNMPGAPQTYAAPVEVTQAGDYTVIVSSVRPWAPRDAAGYYVVHIHATD
uniref:Inhibitor of cysteine protease 1 n=1 Tax=Toxoplasma gondii COUG TaxID=1074873 RepID=A0A2G8XNA8_TOXGO|nr:hypothetical protein TGCOUG_257380 [Toxoplasma gondii COUG]